MKKEEALKQYNDGLEKTLNHPALLKEKMLYVILDGFLCGGIYDLLFRHYKCSGTMYCMVALDSLFGIQKFLRIGFIKDKL